MGVSGKLQKQKIPKSSGKSDPWEWFGKVVSSQILPFKFEIHGSFKDWVMPKSTPVGNHADIYLFSSDRVK